VVQGEELRRRIRAARELAGIRSWEKLVDRAAESPYGYGRSTLKEIGKADEADPRHVLAVAWACKVDMAWFEVPDLRAVVADADPEKATIAERVEALERQIKAQQEQLKAQQEQLKRLSGDERRQPQGALGRGVQGSRPNDGHPQRTGSPEGEDAQRGNGGA